MKNRMFTLNRSVHLQLCQLLYQISIERNAFKEFVFVNTLVMIMQQNWHVLQVRNAKRWYTDLTQIAGIRCSREDLRLQSDVAMRIIRSTSHWFLRFHNPLCLFQLTVVWRPWWESPTIGFHRQLVYICLSGRNWQNQASRYQNTSQCLSLCIDLSIHHGKWQPTHPGSVAAIPSHHCLNSWISVEGDTRTSKPAHASWGTTLNCTPAYIQTFSNQANCDPILVKTLLTLSMVRLTVLTSPNSNFFPSTPWISLCSCSAR